MNGVTGSILQSVKHLTVRGHEVLIIAPNAGPIDADLHGAQTKLLPSMPMPGYPAVRIVSTTATKLAKTLRKFSPDVVHLASPFVLGWAGVRAADALGIPTVAVYQTDVAAYAARYGVAGATSLAASHIARLHRRATLTLAPSTSATAFLTELGVDRLRRWGRGVDADRFAPERREGRVREAFAAAEKVANCATNNAAARGSDRTPNRFDGHTPDPVLVGYAGRLSPEKQVEDLEVLHDLPGIRLVIIGDGPSRESLEKLLPNAHFTGFLGGDDLATALASLDVFVHPGESETFCQGVQEAHASGLPVVATGSGGPLDLVENSITGWLYEPGNLEEMRDRVLDLVGDAAKRQAFAESARAAVRHRTWAALSEQLEAHYLEAIELRQIDDALLTRPRVRPRSEPLPVSAPPAPQWRNYVALGDSITEGIGDTSRMPAGEHLGWAARLGMLLAETGDERGIKFANLAVRSRRVAHLDEQVTRALQLAPDFVSVLAGSNDLVLSRVNIGAVANELERQVARLRGADVAVMLGTPFLPRRAVAKLLAKRFAEYNMQVRRIARTHGCLLLDIETAPEIGDLENWSEDRVHLASAGHRALAYRAAEVLGVPDALILGDLERTLHAPDFGDENSKQVSWLRAHALPWAWRRVRGRTAGDGITAKHDHYITLSATGQEHPQ